MKKLLYTFFFGYLELKWRRLVRTLLLFYMISATILFFQSFIGGWNWDDEEIILSVLILIFITPLFSYILKPFVVKEDL